MKIKKIIIKKNKKRNTPTHTTPFPCSATVLYKTVLKEPEKVQFRR